MRLALREAERALEHDDVPVGAVIVKDGEVIGAGHNERELRNDPTAHAETLALREASARAGLLARARRRHVRDARALRDVRRRDRALADTARRLRHRRPQGRRRRQRARPAGRAAVQPPPPGRRRPAGARRPATCCARSSPAGADRGPPPPPAAAPPRQRRDGPRPPWCGFRPSTPSTSGPEAPPAVPLAHLPRSAARPRPREPLLLVALVPWRGGRAVECAGLENRFGHSVQRGFESPPLRRCDESRHRVSRMSRDGSSGPVRPKLGIGQRGDSSAPASPTNRDACRRCSTAPTLPADTVAESRRAPQLPAEAQR